MNFYLAGLLQLYRIVPHSILEQPSTIPCHQSISCHFSITVLHHACKDARDVGSIGKVTEVEPPYLCRSTHHHLHVEGVPVNPDDANIVDRQHVQLDGINSSDANNYCIFTLLKDFEIKDLIAGACPVDCSNNGKNMSILWGTVEDNDMVQATIPVSLQLKVLADRKNELFIGRAIHRATHRRC